VHLTAIVDSPDHVCCRYRLAAFRPALEAAGHALQLLPWPKSWWSRLFIGRTLRSADVVILQRRLLPRWQIRLVRRAARLLVFDFDDAVFLRDSYAVRGLNSAGRLQRFRATVQAADAVVAGNVFLAAYVRRVRQEEVNDACQLIPTCVEPSRYPLAEHRHQGDGVHLVWIGSSSTLQGLEAIRPLLEQIGQNCAGVHLKLVCDKFLTLDHLPVAKCSWSAESEGAELAAADIGISWVPDDLWSRGKCGLKVLQYMAAGLPVVANPVGVQEELVRHGETGFLAATPEQWVEAIGRLANDAGLRRRLGAAGRRRVEAEFSVAHGAQQWLRLLETLRLRQRVA
jgi:glycosyltransferase involved in cell wall biosynthesis